MTGKDGVKGSAQTIYRELLHALERARTQLAVAIAAESKATPSQRWRYYRETEHRMRQCVKELRAHTRSGTTGYLDLPEVLEVLKHLSLTLAHSAAYHGNAHRFCQRLREDLSRLEKSRTRIED